MSKRSWLILEIAILSIGLCLLGISLASPPRATFLEVTDCSDPAHPKAVYSAPRQSTARVFPGPAAYEKDLFPSSSNPPYKIETGIGVNWPAFWWQNGILFTLTLAYAIAIHFIHRELPLPPQGGFEMVMPDQKSMS